MSEISFNPIRRLSVHHESDWATSWYIDDNSGWQPIVDVANDFPNVNPFSNSTKDIEIAFRHLGLVKVSTSGRQIVITWDLEHAHLKALESAISYLFGVKEPIKVLLRFCHAGWCEETYSTPQASMRRIIQLQALRGKPPEAGIFMRRHDVGELTVQQPTVKSPLLNKGISLWETSSRSLEINDINTRRHILPNVQLLSLDKNDIYRFHHIGSETLISQLFGEVWRRNVIGSAALRSHADTEFEDAVSQPYNSVLESGEPYYDHVRALLVRSHCDPLWISYRRLILPYRTADGRDLLGVYVAPAQNISIPLFNSNRLAVSTRDDSAR